MDTSDQQYKFCQSVLVKRQRVIKRAFDFLLSFGLLLITWPIILLGAFFSTIDTNQFGFFTQRRVGRYGKHFRIIKLRTMRNLPGFKTTITSANDPRITRIGQMLRRSKIDELPQLLNVLSGEMSFVGPRPDVPGFADRLQGEDRIVLCVRPGVTGPATLAFRNEQELMANRKNPEKYNREVIFPEKIRLNKRYIYNYSFSADLRYIFQTVFD